MLPHQKKQKDSRRQGSSKLQKVDGTIVSTDQQCILLLWGPSKDTVSQGRVSHEKALKLTGLHAPKAGSAICGTCRNPQRVTRECDMGHLLLVSLHHQTHSVHVLEAQDWTQDNTHASTAR